MHSSLTARYAKFGSWSPGQAPCGVKPACAKRAARTPPPRSPPPRIPLCPGDLYRGSIARVWLRPELFPGIGVLPGSATESHIVNRGTPVAPLGQPQLSVPEAKSHPVGGPCSPDFPKSPITAGPRTTHQQLNSRKQVTSSAWNLKSRGS